MAFTIYMHLNIGDKKLPRVSVNDHRNGRDTSFMALEIGSGASTTIITGTEDQLLEIADKLVAGLQAAGSEMRSDTPAETAA